MCAYYLGKNQPGDLASVLSGAYNSSSPSTTAPAPEDQQTTRTNTVDTSGKTPCERICYQDKNDCYKEADKMRANDPNRYVACNREFDNCIKACATEPPPPPPPPGGNCVRGEVCTDNAGCPGGECVNGRCKCPPPPCVPNKFCQADTECPGGKCVDEKCQCTPPPPPPAICPEGTGGTALEGCPCGTLYNTLTGKCATGYKFVKRPNNGVRDDWAKEIAPVPGAVGTCECVKWITPGNKGKLGEFKYPPEMQALMDLLLSRGKEFMGLTPGYSQAAQDKMFGRGFENVRGQETGQRQALESGLSRQGMLGTGAGQGMLNDLSWQTEGNVANLARDLFIGNEEKKKQDLLDYTTAAQSVLGGGMGYQQLLEAINSARRGEGSSALQALLAWLMAQQ